MNNIDKIWIWACELYRARTTLGNLSIAYQQQEEIEKSAKLWIAYYAVNEAVVCVADGISKINPLVLSAKCCMLPDVNEIDLADHIAGVMADMEKLDPMKTTAQTRHLKTAIASLSTAILIIQDVQKNEGEIKHMIWKWMIETYHIHLSVHELKNQAWEAHEGERGATFALADICLTEAIVKAVKSLGLDNDALFKSSHAFTPIEEDKLIETLNTLRESIKKNLDRLDGDKKMLFEKFERILDLTCITLDLNTGKA